MTLAPLLQRFVDDELGRSAGLIARTLSSTLEQLQQPRDALLTASERQHYFELVQVLQQHQALYQRSFVEALRALVLADIDPQAQTLVVHGMAASADMLDLNQLELMNETQVTADIEISRAIQQIDNGAEWELRELQSFTSTLRGQAHVTVESNPLRPQSYARALWQAALALPATPVQQAILLRVSATVMAGSLRMAFAAACTRLESAGVQPGVYRTVVIAPGAGREPAPQLDVTRPGALDGLLRSMPTGAANTPGIVDTRRHTQPVNNPGLEQALKRLEELLRRMPMADGSPVAGIAAASIPGVSPPGAKAVGVVGPGVVGAGVVGAGVGNNPSHVAPAVIDPSDTPRLLAHRAALMANATETVDRQIIELLARLFETILVDPSLPAACCAVIGRLQVSALRIALLDPGMLDAHDHPVWALLDRIVMTSASYPQADDPRLAELMRFCTSLVHHMLAEPVQDSALYRRSLARLDAFLAEQLRHQQREAQPAIEALKRAVQAEQLQRNLSSRLTAQMRPIQATPVIQRFVTVTWARVLAESLLRFGDQVEPTIGYLKAVDDLLWTLRLPDHPQSRQRLLGLLPGLLQRLRAGMALIHWPTTEQQVVLDELMRLHSEALRPGARPAAPLQAAPEMSPEEIVKRMREEAVPDAIEPLPFSDSLIDLASMDTVPAELMGQALDSQANDPADWVQRMNAGQRYRIFLHGGWTQVQLLWRSEGPQFALFAGETPHRTHSITQRALERLRAAELLYPLQAHSLIQRAVDGMLRDLATVS